MGIGTSLVASSYLKKNTKLSKCKRKPQHSFNEKANGIKNSWSGNSSSEIKVFMLILKYSWFCRF